MDFSKFTNPNAKTALIAVPCIEVEIESRHGTDTCKFVNLAEAESYTWEILQICFYEEPDEYPQSPKGIFEWYENAKNTNGGSLSVSEGTICIPTLSNLTDDQIETLSAELDRVKARESAADV